MSLYKSKQNKVVESSGGARHESGIFAFKVTKAELSSKGSISLTLDTWNEAKEKGPQVFTYININSENEKALQEVDRRLTTLLGKSDIEELSELVGQSGYVVLYRPDRYLEVYPFGGMYDKVKKSATGKESILERLAEALKNEESQKEATARDIKSDPTAAPEDKSTMGEDGLPF